MSNGFLFGVIVGVVASVVVATDGLGGIFTFIGALAAGVAAILAAADGNGIIGVLVVIGLSLLAGRNWTENRRARKQGEEAWNTRKRFR